MSKTRQRTETDYDMGYADGLKGKVTQPGQYTNQYDMGYTHGKQARKDKK